jgi:hypothetical protein
MIENSLTEYELTHSQIEQTLKKFDNPIERIICLNHIFSDYQSNVKYFQFETNPLFVSLVTDWMDICLKTALDNRQSLSEYEKCILYLMIPNDGDFKFEFFCIVDKLLRMDILKTERNMINTFAQILNGQYLPLFERDWMSKKFIRFDEIPQSELNAIYTNQREIILRQISHEKKRADSEQKGIPVFKKDELKEILTEFFNFRFFDTSVGEHEVEILLDQILESNLKAIDRNSRISLFLSRLENRRIFLYLLNFCVREGIIKGPYNQFSTSLSKVLSIGGLGSETLFDYVGSSRNHINPLINKKTQGLLEFKLVYAQHKNEIKSRKLILFFDSIIPLLKIK